MLPTRKAPPPPVSRADQGRPATTSRSVVSIPTLRAVPKSLEEGVARVTIHASSSSMTSSTTIEFHPGTLGESMRPFASIWAKNEAKKARSSSAILETGLGNKFDEVPSPFAKLPMFEGKYKADQMIGSGSFGEVYKGKCLRTGQVVALKEVEVFHCKPKVINDINTEIEVLKKLKHKNIINLVDLVRGEQRISKKEKGDKAEPNLTSLYMVLEYCPFSLHHLEKRKLSMDTLKAIFYQLLVGVEHMHMMGIIHRDIKPANVLLRPNGTLALADFGLSIKKEDVAFSLMRGTRYYMAPEVYLSVRFPHNFTEKCDLWGVGCVMYKLFTTRDLLNYCNNYYVYKIWKNYIMPERCLRKYNVTYISAALSLRINSDLARTIKDKNARRLLGWLLEVEPEDRYDATKALSHNFFRAEPFPVDFVGLMKELEESANA